MEPIARKGHPLEYPWRIEAWRSRHQNDRLESCQVDEEVLGHILHIVVMDVIII